MTASISIPPQAEAVSQTALRGTEEPIDMTRGRDMEVTRIFWMTLEDKAPGEKYESAGH